MGARPQGIAGEEQAARWVRDTFAAIAPRYDLLNHLLSFNIDRGWRARLLASLAPVVQRPGATVLDLCCGTGDVSLALARLGPARIIGADFCHPMLVSARSKGATRKLPVDFLEADALDLPLPDGSVDAVAIAFGFRNLANYDSGLRELRRILRPGGVLAILEFSHPPNPIVRTLYGWYSRWVLPRLGHWISGSPDAYAYLPASIEAFPRAAALKKHFEEAGFGDAGYRFLTAGIAALHTGIAR